MGWIVLLDRGRSARVVAIVLLALWAVVGSAALGGATARAADEESSACVADTDRSEAALFGWMTRVDSVVGVGPLEIAVDSSFSDILDNVDLGFMGYYETWPRDRDIGFYGDIVHARLRDQVLVMDVINVDYEAAQTYIEAGAFLPRGDPEHPVEVIVGVRYSDLDADYEPTPGQAARSASGGSTRWWARGTGRRSRRSGRSRCAGTSAGSASDPSSRGRPSPSSGTG